MTEETARVEITIRFATEADLPLILSLIKELAEYERLADEVVADVETLGRSLFGERAYAEVVIASLADQPAGFALFFHNFSTFLGKPGLYLEDLYVRPEHRGKKIGERLLRTLARLAVERNCGRLEWWVLDWNESAIAFYQRLDAEAMDDWTVYRVSGAALVTLANQS